MSVNATAPLATANPVDAMFPTLPSENAETAASGTHTLGMFGAEDDEPSFWDLLDVVNPLQHIPLVNDVYREISGDQIGVAARLAGGVLFGGPVGLAGAVFNCVVEEASGDTPGGHMLALLEGDTGGDAGTALARNDEAAPAVTATPPGGGDVKTAAPAAPVVLLGMADSAEPAPPPAVPLPPVTTSAVPAATDKTAAPAQVTAVKAATDTSAGGANSGNSAPLLARQQSAETGKPSSMPARTGRIATQSPPYISGTVTSGNYRAFAPITGHRPQAAMAGRATAGSVVTAAQSVEVAHPAEAPATANTVAPAATSESGSGKTGAETGADVPATAAPAAITAADSSSHWFVAAMANGLDKYERSLREPRKATDIIDQ